MKQKLRYFVRLTVVLFLGTSAISCGAVRNGVDRIDRFHKSLNTPTFREAPGFTVTRGSKTFFSKTKGNTTQVLIRESGQKDKKLVGLSEGQWINDFRLSKEGQHLALGIAANSGPNDIWIVDLGGAIISLSVVLDGQYDLCCPTWMEDGNLAFITLEVADRTKRKDRVFELVTGRLASAK